MIDTVNEINKQKNKTAFLSKLNKIVVVLTFLLFLAVGTVVIFAIGNVHTSAENYFAGIVNQTVANLENEAKIISLSDEIVRLENLNKNNADIKTLPENSTVNSPLQNEPHLIVNTKPDKFSQAVKSQISKYGQTGGISGCVVSLNGDYIFKNNITDTDFNNLFKENIKFLYMKADDVLNKLQEGKPGSFWFKAGKEVYLASFSPFNNGKEMLLMTAPAQTVTLNVDKTVLPVFLITGLLALVLAILLAYSEKQIDETDELMDKYCFTEPLTGGANFADFEIEVSEILNGGYGEQYNFIALNIKNFNILTRLYGKEKSDEILKSIFDIVSVNLSPDSICAKYGESCFIIFYVSENSGNECENFVIKTKELTDRYNEEIIPVLNESRGGQIVTPVEIEFGIYPVSDLSLSVSKMSEFAFATLQNVHPDSFYEICDEKVKDLVLFDEFVDKEMFKSLSEGQFKMYLQPEFEFKSEKYVGAEALVRWVHPEKGVLLPTDFISLFEKKGFVFEIAKYMLEQACKFLNERKENGKALFPISLNVSPVTLNNLVFPETAVLITQKYEISPEFIRFEFAKSVYEMTEKNVFVVAEKLKNNGFEISADGFGPGTGFDVSSVLNPKPYCINFLNEFIVNSVDDVSQRTLMAGICAVARKLGIKTCAKNVETEDLAKFVFAAGFNTVKGFLYGKPVPAEHYSSAFLNNE